jgi:hypothetical protein
MTIYIYKLVIVIIDYPVISPLYHHYTTISHGQIPILDDKNPIPSRAERKAPNTVGTVVRHAVLAPCSLGTRAISPGE